MNYDYIKCGDCMELMKELPDESVHVVLTDIPYDGVNLNQSRGLRMIEKGKADIITFDLNSFLQEVYRVAKGTIIIFCGINQVSEIYTFFREYQNKGKGTVRQLIWEKTNPSPMNGQHIYLSGTENAVWFKKRAGVFNAFCKNTVFKYPSGKSDYHPTQKNVKLFEELILDNTNKGDIVLDPCIGGGTTALAAFNTGRHFIGYELDNEYYEIARKRIEYEMSEIQESFL